MKGNRCGTVGLDLSLRSTAVAFIPDDWTPGDWNAVCTMSTGYPLPKGVDHKARAQRLHFIATELTSWIGPFPKMRVYVEDYAYGLAGQSGMVLGELGGAVKLALYAIGHVVVPVNQSTVRKYLLGKLPPKDRGAATIQALKDFGAEFPNSDEADAFVVANYARTEHGLPGLTLG